MIYLIQLHNTGGILDSREAKTPREAAIATIQLVKEAGELHHRDHINVSEHTDDYKYATMTDKDRCIQAVDLSQVAVTRLMRINYDNPKQTARLMADAAAMFRDAATRLEQREINA